MPADSVLDHLEKGFADSYRKEIEQEENVWRSLPFFAATLALELTAVAQLRDWFATRQGVPFWVAAVLLGAAALCTLVALFALARSIAPAAFRYVLDEPALIAYAETVRAEAAARPGAVPETTEAATLAALRALLLDQYAASAAHNRRINRRRAEWRTLAGIATLLSVLLLLVLLAVSIVLR